MAVFSWFYGVTRLTARRSSFELATVVAILPSVARSHGPSTLAVSHARLSVLTHDTMLVTRPGNRFTRACDGRRLLEKFRLPIVDAARVTAFPRSTHYSVRCYSIRSAFRCCVFRSSRCRSRVFVSSVRDSVGRARCFARCKLQLSALLVCRRGVVRFRQSHVCVLFAPRGFGRQPYRIRRRLWRRPGKSPLWPASYTLFSRAFIELDLLKPWISRKNCD